MDSLIHNRLQHFFTTLLVLAAGLLSLSSCDPLLDRPAGYPVSGYWVTDVAPGHFPDRVLCFKGGEMILYEPNPGLSLSEGYMSGFRPTKAIAWKYTLVAADEYYQDHLLYLQMDSETMKENPYFNVTTLTDKNMNLQRFSAYDAYNIMGYYRKVQLEGEEPDIEPERPYKPEVDNGNGQPSNPLGPSDPDSGKPSQPVIKPYKTELVYEPEGNRTYVAHFEIIGGDGNAKPSVQSTASWIKIYRIDFSTITFEPELNRMMADRSGYLVIHYPGAEEARIKVTQRGYPNGNH